MRSLDSTALGRASDAGPLLMRIGLGTVFAWHGWVKFDGGVSNFAGFLDSLNVPAPEVVAWLQIAAEGIGGLLLIVGLLTRFVTLPLIAIMIGAITLVKAEGGFIVDGGPGASYETALMAGLLCLLFIGPGRVSLDAVIGLEGRRMLAGPPRGRTAVAT
jgi:putative oxidoreductase